MEDKEPKQRIYDDLGLESAGISYESFSKKFDSDPEARKSVYKDLGLEQAGVDYQTFETKIFGQKKNSIGSDASTGGKVGALETPSIGSSSYQEALGIKKPTAPTPLVTPFQQKAIKPVSQKDESLRPDGTKKDIGFLGEFKTPSGKSVTEYSIGVPINGKEMDIPTLVPTLTEEEKKYIIDKAEKEEQIGRDAIGSSIVKKSIAHAEQRIKEGKSPFFSSSEKMDEKTFRSLIGLKETPKNIEELKLIQKASKPIDIEKEKYGQENRIGYFYNSFLNGIGSMSAGAADAFFNVVKNIPGAIGPSMEDEDATKEFRESIEPSIRKGIKNIAGSKISSEKENKYNDEFWTSAIGGLASSVPAMITPYGVGLYAQAYDSGLESINNTEKGKDLPETTKTIFAASVGLAQGVLEKYSLDKIFGKQSSAVASKMATDAIAELAEKGITNVTTEAFEKIIENGAKGLKNKIINAGGKITEGIASEFFTGAAQETSTIAAEKLINLTEKKEIFEPTSWGDLVGRIVYSGAQESVGGGIMGAFAAPFSKTRNYIAEKVAEAKTQEDYQKLHEEFVNNAPSETAAEIANKVIDLYANINAKIPQDTPNRKETIEKVVERDEIKDLIKQKQSELDSIDEAFKPRIQAEIDALNGRIAEINQEIANPVTPTVTLNKNTTPTEEKYGTIDRGDGKGVVDLTRAEYEAELAKQGGEETEETTVFETDKTESRQPIDLSIEPTAPTEGVEAGQEQVKEAVSVSDKKADIERRRKEKLNAKDKQSGKLIRDFDSNADIIEKRRVIDEFIKNKGENLESIEGWNDLRGDIQELLFEGKFDEAKAKVPQTYEEKINSIYDAELARELYKEMKAGKLVADMTPAEQQVANKYITEELKKSVDAELKAGQEQVAPTTQEEKGALGIPSNTDKAYQEAQGVTERVSKAHPEASVLVLPKGNDLSLTALYVGKEKRGKGIGSGVLESVKAEADKLGKKVVLDATNELDNDTDLERLGEFYERNGFVKVGENKFEYTPKKNQLLTPNINQNETVNENVREIGNGQKDGQKGDVSQEAKSNVQEGEEKVAEGEEPTAEQVDKASKAVGTTPSNLRDLYRVNRDLFGQNRVRAFASAIAMDRMIGAMAKRAGIPKQRMYEKLQFRKASEQELPQGVKFQLDAWHGSPYQFDRFTTEKIGTGEGAQAFGWGLYFTDLEGIARSYAEKLSDYQVIIDGKPSYESSFWRLETTLNYNPKAWVGMSKEDIANEIKKDTGIDKLTKQEILSELEKVKTIKIDTNRILYKTTLHQGKTPDQYTWLEWDKPIEKESLLNSVLSEIRKIDEKPNSLRDFQRELSAAQDDNYYKQNLLKYSGKDFYIRLSESIGQKEASLLLLRAGIDGVKYPAESISRGATGDTARGFNYVVFDENAVSIEEVIKFQKDAEKARGAMMMALDGQAIIYALSDPNVSTPLHEMAHVFEHYLTESERQTIIRNAGTGAWTTETSEYFARGFEKYLAEGVSPTKELQKVFEKFKEWLTEIYNGITGSEIDIQLNDEMRAIYAQMFGEEEVNSKFKPNEKITQKEDGKPLPEGVSGVRTETEERQTSPELRPQEEEVRSIIDNAVANFYAINEATKRSEKREAAKEYRQNLEKMPTVKNIFDNIKSIFAQLEAEGVITKSKDCP